MKSYTALAGIPHLPRLFLWSMLARLNVSMLPIGLTLVLVGWNGSYAVAGVLGGALTAGQALVGPARGRAADWGAARKLLVLTGIGYLVGLGVLVLMTRTMPGGGWPIAVLVALLTGMSTVPISQVSRAVWPKIVPSELGRTLFTLEATGSEVMQTTGPLLTSLLVTALDPGYAVMACGIVAFVGALAFAAALGSAGIRSGADQTAAKPQAETETAAETGADAGTEEDTATSASAVTTASAPEPEERRTLFVLPKFTLGIVVTLAMMAAIFSVNLSLVAWARDSHESGLSGVLIACWTTGSAVGGFGVGALRKDVPHSARLAAMAVGMALLAVLLPPVTETIPVWLVLVVLFLGGTAIAPSMAANFMQVSGAVPQERRAEAFGWLATAGTGGAALSMPVTGVLLDASGPAVSVAVGAVLALCAMVLSYIGSKRAERNDEVVPAEA
ncbi:MFS transporter [Streptomyces shenzhenensis]|uniref:MFS transporter n=1 Tax=Streptomyces shenzhenensis TaxID=943815 RepID=UPI0036ABAAEF